MGRGGGNLSRFVRPPEDDDEKRRVEHAIATGAGISIAQFAERIVGEPVDEEFIEVIKSRLERAGTVGESFDIESEIEILWKWRKEMA